MSYKNREKVELPEKFEFGKIYFWNKSDTVKVPNWPSYDKKTKNFHIISDDLSDEAGKISKFRESLIEKIEIDERFKKEKSIKAAVKYGENKPALLKRHGSRSSKKIDPSQIEKYIGVYYQSFFYMLCFEEMFIEKNTVCNVIGNIQYFRCPCENGELININKKKNNELDVCYPYKKEKLCQKSDGRLIQNTAHTLDSPEKDVIEGFYIFIKSENLNY